MYNDAVNMLTSINQSLLSRSPEISIKLEDDTEYRIPSLLYLDNKVEELSSSIESLVNLNKTGSAWLTHADNMHKIELSVGNSVPNKPDYVDSGHVHIRDNNFLKDLVSPYMYLRLNVQNIPDTINEYVYKKIVIYSPELFTLLSGSNLQSYKEYKQALFNYVPGRDYDEYDAHITAPTKYNKYDSRFEILDVTRLDNSHIDGLNNTYRIRINTFKYTGTEDNAIEQYLRVGDKLTIPGRNVVYKITKLENSNRGDKEFYIEVEEEIGHTVLQPINEDDGMYFVLYNESFSEFRYVDIPLEENRYICVFIGSVVNNVRGEFSKPFLVDLEKVFVKDRNNQYVYDNDVRMNYIQYYKKYCRNIGDIILGLTEVAYPSIRNFNNFIISEIVTSDTIKSIVSATFVRDNVQVVQINKHLIDNNSSKDVINLHKQKQNINASLTALQSSIDDAQTKILEGTSNTTELKKDISKKYEERIALQKQYISIIDNINNVKDDIYGFESPKFAVRGVTSYDTLETTLKDTYNEDINVIALDIEYKYSNTSSNNTAITGINTRGETSLSVWNKQQSVERERSIVFDSVTGAYKPVFKEGQDVGVRWNQLDIPIVVGEDVTIRFRYKYSIGQPFIDLYTPWSEEFVIQFPQEYADVTSIYNIVTQNNADLIESAFIRHLLNEGYQEHVDDKILGKDRKFYHAPESIYSGFTDKDSKMLSLKDKLTDLNSELQQYKALIESELHSNLKVYLEYDDKKVELHRNNHAHISFDHEELTSGYAQKRFNIVIKNENDTNLNLYSIFPGDIKTPLLCTNADYYEYRIGDYERTPFHIKDDTKTARAQTLGQFIYFRTTDAYTGKSYYYDSPQQRMKDLAVYKKNTVLSNDGKSKYNIVTNKILGSDLQLPLPYRYRISDKNSILSYVNSGTIKVVSNKVLNLVLEDNNLVLKTDDRLDANNTTEQNVDVLNNLDSIKYDDPDFLDTFVYNTVSDIYRYADIPVTSDDKIKNPAKNSQPGTEFLSKRFGAVLYPELKAAESLQCNKYDKYQYSTIDSNKDITIPVVMDYMLQDDGEQESYTKTIAFDIRPALLKELEHYIISITVNKRYKL